MIWQRIKAESSIQLDSFNYLSTERLLHKIVERNKCRWITEDHCYSNTFYEKRSSNGTMGFAYDCFWNLVLHCWSLVTYGLLYQEWTLRLFFFPFVVSHSLIRRKIGECRRYIWWAYTLLYILLHIFLSYLLTNIFCRWDEVLLWVIIDCKLIHSLAFMINFMQRWRLPLFITSVYAYIFLDKVLFYFVLIRFTRIRCQKESNALFDRSKMNHPDLANFVLLLATQMI